MSKLKIAIIGGGAAGFFAAINAKENYPHSELVIFEKSKKLLSKVKVSGGGRCNVTNSCTSFKTLAEAYPRGGKSLKKLLMIFSTTHIIKWFEGRGVPLKTEEDQRVFPVSDNSQDVIDCLLKETNRLSIQILMNHPIQSIQLVNDQLVLSSSNNPSENEPFDKVVVACGGSPKRAGLHWLEELGHKIENPVPSLFTFNMPGASVCKLMGVSVPRALVNVQGTKLKSQGAVLITHWGMSGPAILKLSAFGARVLNDLNYNFKIQVNWTGEKNSDHALTTLNNIITEHAKKKLISIKPFGLPERLWNYLIEKSNLSNQILWGDIGKKIVNKLIEALCNDQYAVSGKTTFKEEFVTCGGVSLDSVDMNTMKSKVCNNLYFAGEILDIDGITGGFNFQAAWTTAFIAARLA